MSLNPEQMLAVLGALPDPVFVLTESGRYAGVFGGTDEGYYHDGRALVGRRLQDVLPQELAAWVRQNVDASLRENRLVKVEYKLSAEQVVGLQGRDGPEGAIWFEGYIQPFPSPIDGERAVVWVARNITQRKLLEAELRRNSQIDPLTGAFNRRKLGEVLEQYHAQYRRYGHPCSALVMDIDNFKRINDNFGHMVGDQVLLYMSKGCQEILRETDLLVRYGGEEFVVLLPNTSLEEAQIVAERLRKRVKEKIVHQLGREKSVTISVGISSMHSDDDSHEMVIRRADHALYEAKRTGRDRVVVSCP